MNPFVIVKKGGPGNFVDREKGALLSFFTTQKLPFAEKEDLMNLYLVQHGRPLPKEENPEKPLSEAGRMDIERTAAFLRRAGVVPEVIFHSGKTRALQTAEIMADVLRPSCTPLQRDGLAPKDDVEEICRDMEGTDRDTMLVGHLPHLGRLAGRLITGDAARPVAAFQQGAVLCLRPNEEQKGWQVAWMLAPEIMTS